VSEKIEFSTMDTNAFITGKQILVVEDEPAISSVLSRLLTRAPGNHQVDIAADGQAALACLARRSYDLISLDYVLPGSLSGMDIYRHVRQHQKNVPILFMSGNIEFLESIRTLQQQDPHLDHLSKPCRNKEYLCSINRLLEKGYAVHSIR
jgi:DNA-binding response OmpR family regulator